MKITLTQDEYNISIWKLEDLEYYRSIQTKMPSYLWLEFNEEWGHYYPIYFPIGMLIQWMTENGYLVEIIY